MGFIKENKGVVGGEGGGGLVLESRKGGSIFFFSFASCPFFLTFLKRERERERERKRERDTNQSLDERARSISCSKRAIFCLAF